MTPSKQTGIGTQSAITPAAVGLMAHLGLSCALVRTDTAACDVAAYAPVTSPAPTPPPARSTTPQKDAEAQPQPAARSTRGARAVAFVEAAHHPQVMRTDTARFDAAIAATKPSTPVHVGRASRSRTAAAHTPNRVAERTLRSTRL